MELEVTTEEQVVIRSLKRRAADVIAEGGTEIEMARAEFQVAFLHEELHLLAKGPGHPITSYFYGLTIKHTGKSN